MKVIELQFGKSSEALMLKLRKSEKKWDKYLLLSCFGTMEIIAITTSNLYFNYMLKLNKRLGCSLQFIY